MQDPLKNLENKLKTQAKKVIKKKEAISQFVRNILFCHFPCHYFVCRPDHFNDD
jgi:hypothetical protein